MKVVARCTDETGEKQLLCLSAEYPKKRETRVSDLLYHRMRFQVPPGPWIRSAETQMADALLKGGCALSIRSVFGKACLCIVEKEREKLSPCKDDHLPLNRSVYMYVGQ